jgi:hypothetical protein
MKHSQEEIGLLVAHLMEWKEVLDQDPHIDMAASALDRTVTALELAASEMMLVLSVMEGDDTVDSDTEVDAFANLHKNSLPHLYSDPGEEELDED